MALVDFMRYFTGRAIALRAKPRDVAANRPLRMRCELVPGETADVYYFEQRGVKDPAAGRLFPAGWPVRATTVWPTPPPPTAASAGWSARGGGHPLPGKDHGRRLPLQRVCRDQTGAMRVAEVRLPKPRPTPEQTCSQAQEKPAE